MPSSQPETKKKELTVTRPTLYKQGSMKVSIIDGKWDASLFVYSAEDAVDAIAVLDAARIDAMNES